MLFNSFAFLEFTLLFFVGWPWAKRRPSLRYVYLITFSFLFYAWAKPWWLLLLVVDGMVDFSAGLAMYRWPSRRGMFLALSLGANLGLLFVFKYSHFFATNTNGVLGLAGLSVRVPDFTFELPIGISFYTFQSLSYTISVYRGVLIPTSNLLHFFAYISLWPQLVAGPIERAAELLPQLAQPLELNAERKWEGLVLMISGYFKKMVLADNLAPAVNQAFGAAGVIPSLPYWWLVGTEFAIQIYCDFSGYTDIARGMAKWMGFDFMLNFDHPYGSTSIREFWQRWHISLSTWFRDFVYIPLGGNRASTWRGLSNLWITMLVSGFWHGAAWTFVVWGALHAAYLSVERVTGWPDRLEQKVGRGLVAMLVFGLVVIGWIFFRARSLSQAIAIVATMFNLRAINFAPVVPVWNTTAFFVLVALAMFVWSFLGAGEFLRERLSPSAHQLEPAFWAAAAVGSVYWRGPGAAFIYFQF